MNGWHAETYPQRMLPGSAAGILGAYERVNCKPDTGRRTQ